MNAPALHLLLIEDVPGDARLLQEMLRDTPAAHVQLVWVDRLAKGLARIAQGGVDAAIVDLALPDATDLDCVIKVRQAAPDLPIIVLTGSASDEKALRALRAGAQDYLVKGWADSELILRTIRYAIERKRTEQELARYTRELRTRNEQLRTDLQLAHEIQMALLPQQYPNFPPTVQESASALTFHHYYQSATYLAGDFFDILPISDTASGVFICDVMGHGVRAALVTAMIRPLVDEFSNRADAPGELLTNINRELCNIFKQAGTTIYATAFCLVADVATGELTFADAGHPPAFLLRRDADVQPLRVTGQNGPALGLFGDSKFPTSRVRLQADDKILLYTDGLFEIDNAAGEQYGQERLAEAVQRHRDLTAAELIPVVLAKVKQFAAGKDFTDDVCLLAVHCHRLLGGQ
jgi:sigma-B regulation protein RsbU (phosphoserine phosphatase)